MELIQVIQKIVQDSLQGAQLSDIVMGTVTSTSPLQISINTTMQVLREPIIYLTEAVIEKKIPVLSHTHNTGSLEHSHTVNGLSHSHTYQNGLTQDDTGTALSGSYGTSSALGSISMDAGLDDIQVIENGKLLPVEDGYIIINRGLSVGDKVILLRVQNGQKFVVLSRVF